MWYKKTTLSILLAATITSCSLFKKVTSNTSISANNSFVLGNNEHSEFSVKITNVSNQTLEIKTKPINEAEVLLTNLKPKATENIVVKRNTALVIQNNTNQTVNVELLIKGDTGLSMGYKK